MNVYKVWSRYRVLVITWTARNIFFYIAICSDKLISTENIDIVLKYSTVHFQFKAMGFVEVLSEI